MLRFGKGQRSWLAAHNVTAVLALPLHLMITYTGLVSLASLYAPAPIAAAFANEDSYYAAAFPQGGDVVATREAAFYAYSTNCLIDLDHAVIVDVEATTSVRQAEVTAQRRMIERTKQRFGI